MVCTSVTRAWTVNGKIRCLRVVTVDFTILEKSIIVVNNPVGLDFTEFDFVGSTEFSGIPYWHSVG